MTAAVAHHAASVAADLTAGAILRKKGVAGLWRAVAPCQDRQGRAWWFLPCDRAGVWTRHEGWRAFYPEDCEPVPPVRTRRHYRRREP